MPNIPKRHCSNRCGRLIETGSRCRQCQKQNEQRRGSSTQRGYDEDHRKLRLQCFVRDGWKCVDCGWEPDIVRDCRTYSLDTPPPALILEELRVRWHGNQRHLHGDHDIAIDQRPDLRLDLDNYKTRCNECHAAKTDVERAVRVR
jgi:hypothetical protein